MSAQRRYALIIASDSYTDKKLTQLKAPNLDAKKLKDLFENDSIGGGYNVHILSNENSYTIKLEIEKFVETHKEKNDLLLLYFACHGHKSTENGLLYLASKDTDLKYLEATTISANFINTMIKRTKSKVILILDCCYSGAFTRGWSPYSDAKLLNISDEFSESESESGCIILTSANAMQFSWEGNNLQREEQGIKYGITDEFMGLYTNLLIKGIESGEADLNEDGSISCQELCQYIKGQMKEKDYPQNPEIYLLKNDLTIAFNPKSIKNNSSSDSNSIEELTPIKLNDYTDQTRIHSYQHLAIDKKDLLYVLTDKCYKINSLGKRIYEINNVNPSSADSFCIAVGPSNYFYVAQGMMEITIKKFSLSGKEDTSWTYGFFDYPTAIVVDSKEFIYISDYYNHIKKFNNSGIMINEFGSKGTANGEFSHITAMALDSNDHLFVADESFRIQTFSSNGDFLKKFQVSKPDYNNSINFMCFDSAEYLYIFIGQNQHSGLEPEYKDIIKKFDKNGKHLSDIKIPKKNNLRLVGMAINSKDVIYLALLHSDSLPKFIVIDKISTSTIENKKVAL